MMEHEPISELINLLEGLYTALFFFPGYGTNLNI